MSECDDNILKRNEMLVLDCLYRGCENLCGGGMIEGLFDLC